MANKSDTFTFCGHESNFLGFSFRLTMSEKNDIKTHHFLGH